MTGPTLRSRTDPRSRSGRASHTRLRFLPQSELDPWSPPRLSEITAVPLQASILNDADSILGGGIANRRATLAGGSASGALRVGDHDELNRHPVHAARRCSSVAFDSMRPSSTSGPRRRGSRLPGMSRARRGSPARRRPPRQQPPPFRREAARRYARPRSRRGRMRVDRLQASRGSLPNAGTGP